LTIELITTRVADGGARIIPTRFDLGGFSGRRAALFPSRGSSSRSVLGMTTLALG
jgi:hypothetical protein